MNSKNILAILLLALLVSASVILNNSLFANPAQNVDKRPRFVIILLDETDSFGQNSEHGVAKSLYWNDALAMTRIIVKQLNPGDELIVLAIDERGFEEEDILVPMHQFDRAFLKSRIEKKKIIRKIMALQRRKDKYSQTDILGALYQAAYFTGKETDFKTVIFCFSDMRQEPRWPTATEAKDLSFPPNTTAYFFFVDASGKERWQRLVDVWKPIFKHARLEIQDGGSLNFFQYGESATAVKRILQDW